jgi:hypothetical protein
MDKSKRSYFLPTKLVTAFDKECKKSGLVRERVVAASIATFLKANPNDRAKMFQALEELLAKRGK